MAVQGSLKTITIPELFSLLHQLRKTGVLTLVTEADERNFLFYRGNLIFATARDGSRRIGTYLVRLGIISQEELNSCLARISTSDVYLGQRLLESGRLEPRDINAAVEAQILDLLGEAMTWPTGAFQFDDEELPFAIPDGTPISTHSTILEAARRGDERNFTQTIFPRLDGVVSVTGGEAPADLEDTARQILALVDSERSIEDLIHLSPVGERATVSALQELTGKGLVATSPPGSKDVLQKGMQELCGAPIAPNVPGKLFAIFNGDCQRIPKLVEVLLDDPILTAKALKAVATKGKDIPRSELGVRRLATTLGAFELRSLLLPEALRGLFFARPSTFWKVGWEHSIFCARVCKGIADLVEYPFAEEAYLAGLLHNLGLFFLHHQDPARYERLVERSYDEHTDIELLEEKEIGISHPRLGGLQADNWLFPRTVALAIRGHNKVDANTANPLLNILAASCGLAEECGLRVGYVPTLAGQHKAALKKLCLSGKRLMALVKQTPRVAAATVA